MKITLSVSLTGGDGVQDVSLLRAAARSYLLVHHDMSKGGVVEVGKKFVVGRCAFCIIASSCGAQAMDAATEVEVVLRGSESASAVEGEGEEKEEEEPWLGGGHGSSLESAVRGEVEAWLQCPGLVRGCIVQVGCGSATAAMAHRIACQCGGGGGGSSSSSGDGGSAGDGLQCELLVQRLDCGRLISEAAATAASSLVTFLQPEGSVPRYTPKDQPLEGSVSSKRPPPPPGTGTGTGATWRVLVLERADVLLHDATLVDVLADALDSLSGDARPSEESTGAGAWAGAAFVLLSCDLDTSVPDVLTTNYRLGPPLRESLPDADARTALLDALVGALEVTYSHFSSRSALVTSLSQLSRGMSRAEMQRAVGVALVQAQAQAQTQAQVLVQVGHGAGADGAGVSDVGLVRAMEEAPRAGSIDVQQSGQSGQGGGGGSPPPQLIGLASVLTRVAAMTRDSVDPAQSLLYARLGIRPCSGVLITGPAGSGKTALARAIAAQAAPAFAFLEASCAELVHKVVGQSEAKVAELFAAARARSPAFLLLDNLDVLLGGECEGEGEGNGGHGEGGGKSCSSPAPLARKRTAHKALDRILSMLLMEMDGLESGSGVTSGSGSGSGACVDSSTVIVLATCTDARLLDGALLRPGRLEHHVPLAAPDAEGRAALLTHFLQDTPLEHTAAAMLQAEDTRLPATASVADIKGLADQLIFSHITRQIQHDS